MLKKLLPLLASMLLTGAALAQSNSLEVTNAWARATPGKAENGAAYLTIRSPTSDKVTSVSTPVAQKAELHTMTMHGNIMQMRPLAALDLPAGQPVALKPGGTHVMLMGLKEPLKAGETFPLELHLASGATREVTVAVEGIGSMGPGHASGGGAAMKMPMPAGR